MITTIFLVVGLGNPGSAYENTNHNVGFLCIDFLVKSFELSPFKKKFDSLYTEKSFDNFKVVFTKPQTFMNLSGEAIQQFVHFYKVNPMNIVVIHDDLDLLPGKVKIKFSGSSGGHNGIKSVDKCIGSEYWRIRVGIGRPEDKQILITDYVLSQITSKLKKQLLDVFNVISSNLKEFLLEASPKLKSISKISQLTSKNSVISDVSNSKAENTHSKSLSFTPLSKK